MGVDATDVEHAAARFPQMWQGGPRQLEGHEHVHRHDPLEEIARRRGEIPRGDDRRIVDDSIEPAKRVDGQVDKPLGTAGIGKLLDMDDRPSFPVSGHDLRGDGAGQVGLEAMDDDARPLGSSAAGDRRADASGAAGDDHDFLCQAHGQFLWWVEGL